MKALAILTFAFVVATGASADTITFNFGPTPGDLGTSATFTSSGVSITASSATDLFYKVQGGDETGLGLAAESQQEIGVGQSINFDLSSLLSQNVTNLTLVVGSIQSGESAQVCDVNNVCVTFSAADDDKVVSIMTIYADMLASQSGQLTITGLTGNVLVDQLQATTSGTIPEPNTLLLIGTGVFAMAGTVRRRLLPS